jgi:hypothetical protein
LFRKTAKSRGNMRRKREKHKENQVNFLPPMWQLNVKNP